MGSTPTVAASEDENSAKGATASTRDGAADAKPVVPGKKPVVKKAAKKKVTSRKTAKKKAASKKVASKKTAKKKADKMKTVSKKTAQKKAAGKKVEAGEGQSEGKIRPRSRRRPGLAGRSSLPPAEASPGEATAVDATRTGTTDDPRSLSWMAASARNALDAVRAHQAEKAALPQGTPDDDLTEEPGVTEEMPSAGSAEPEVSGTAPERAEPAAVAASEVAEADVGDTPATAVVAAEPRPDTPTTGVPVGGAATSSPGTSTLAEKPGGEETDSAADEAREVAVAGIPEKPDASEAVPARQELPASDDIFGEGVADVQKAATPEAQQEEVAMNTEATAASPAQEVPSAPAAPGTASPAAPPPPVVRESMSARMIVVVVAVGAAILYGGYRLVESRQAEEVDVTTPVVSRPSERSPIADISRPAITAVPATAPADTTPGVAASAGSAADDEAIPVTEAEPAPVVAGQQQRDVVTESGTTHGITAAEPAPVPDTGMSKAPSPAPVTSQNVAPAATAVADETPAGGDVPDAASLEAVTQAEAPAAIVSTDATPDATTAMQETARSAAVDPVPAGAPSPSEAGTTASEPAPVARQPAYRAPGYGYYSPNRQQPGYQQQPVYQQPAYRQQPVYRQPAWQTPAPR